MQAIKEEARQCGTARTALPDTHLLNLKTTISAANLHGERARCIQRLNCSKHAPLNIKASKAPPQEPMLDSIISLLNVNEPSKEGHLANAGTIHKKPQGKQMMGC